MLKFSKKKAGAGLAKIRIMAFFTSVILLFSAFSGFSAQAIEGGVMSTISVQWANPQKIKKIEKTDTEAILTANVNYVPTNIYISFPKEGGVRVRTDVNNTIHEPDSFKTIKYYNIADGTMLLDAGDIAVRLTYSSYPWKMEYINSKSEVIHTMTARNLFFGFKGGVVRKVKISSPINEDEVFYGLGGRYNTFIQNGYRAMLWNVDTSYHTSKPTDERPHAYTNVPLLHSSNGYSVLFDTYYGGWANIGYDDPKVWYMEFNGPDFEYYVYTEQTLKNIESYTNLTGKPATVPKWALGYWIGQVGTTWWYGDNDADRLANGVAYIDSTLSKYKELGTMPAAAYLENGMFDSTGSTFPKEGFETVLKYGVKPLSWSGPASALNGNMSGWTVPNISGVLDEITDLFELPVTRNYDGTGFTDHWGDFSNPLATEVLKRVGYDYYITRGLAGTMLDYGEYIEENTSYYNGMKGDEMHQYYVYAFNQRMNEVFSSYDIPDGYILFGRDNTYGTHIYSGLNGGDVRSDFDGLRMAYYQGLSCSSSGFGYFGVDIGGVSGDPTTEQYLRWLQFSTFNPIMRAHGSSDRNPWTFGDISLNTFTDMYWLRTAMIDYMYSATLESGISGHPMVQPMQMAFPKEYDLADITNQYLFCNEMLVCPVLEENTFYRDVELPKGIWTNVFTGVRYASGKHTVSSTVNEIPVYLRDGAVLKVDVSKNFSMFEDMADKSYDAILVATSTEKRTITHREDNATYKFTNTPDAENAFTVSNDDNNPTKLVIAAGVTASSVKVNGAELKKLDKLPSDDTAVGYYVDVESRRTLIFTGGNWKTVSVANNQTALKDLATEGTITANSQILTTRAKAVIDADFQTFWAISSTANSKATIDLGEVKDVNEIVVAWSTYSPASYTLEASEDGSKWTNINNNVSLGGREEYDVEGSQIRYIRISEVVKKAGLATPSLVSIEAYGEETITEEVTAPITDNNSGDEDSSNEGSNDDGSNDSNDDGSDNNGSGNGTSGSGKDDYDENSGKDGDKESGSTTDDSSKNDTSKNDDDDDDGNTTTKKRYKKVVVKGDGGLSLWIIILIIVGGVLLVAAGVLIPILLYRRKKKKEAAIADVIPPVEE